MRRGRKSAAQTPAPANERIYGSKKNKPKSASSEKSASSIKLNEKITQSLKTKLKDFKETHKTEKVSLNDLKAVYRRGLGAYSSTHRPTISGGMPNTRNAWAMARVNKFLKKAGGAKVKKAYVQDDDLLKYDDGGEITNICIEEIIKIINSIQKVKDYFVIDKKLVIVFEEELMIFSAEMINYHISQFIECHDVINPELNLNYNEDYKSIYFNMKKEDATIGKFEKGGKIKKSKKTAYGDCYKVSGDYIIDNSISPLGKTVYLVHAEVQGQGDFSKIRYGHAWIEDNSLVYDFSNNRQIILPKFIYYNIGQVNEKDPKKYRRYTVKEARKKMLETGNYGSWDIETDYAVGGKLSENEKTLFKMIGYQKQTMENGGEVKITCVNCMWEWILDNAEDKYVCHQCGFDNSLFYTVLKETKTLEEIAEKHGVDIEYLKNQLEIGKDSEKAEHIKVGSGILGDEIAETIALHHLDEEPNYYEEYDDEIIDLQKDLPIKYAEFSVWYNDEAYDYADLSEAIESLKNSEREGVIRDFSGNKVANTVSVMNNEKIRYSHGGKTPKEMYENPTEFLELQKEEADALLFSRRTLLGKSMIANAYIEMAEKRLNEAEGGIEKNIWQEVINIWNQTKKDLNEYVFTYEEGGMTEDGAKKGCGCTKYAKGGLAYGNSHAKGGIPLKVKNTGQNIEIEGGEGVINKRSMQMTKKVEFQGQKMTPCEVISKINQMGGGVKFNCGDVKEIVDKDGKYE